MIVCTAGNLFRRLSVQNASISVPIIRKAFAVLILRKLRWLHRDFTAMNARLPAINPAALLLIYASVLLDILFSSFLKDCIHIICKYSVIIRILVMAKVVIPATPSIVYSKIMNFLVTKISNFTSFCDVCI